MTTLPSMSLVLPTRGAAGSGTWHNALDAALTLIDGHDHTTGKGVRVPSAGLNINADISFASLYAPTNLHRLSFASVSTPSTNKSLFVGTDNELRFRNSSGTSIQITDGTSLNVAAFTGGIGGDYASVGAEVAFDDAGDRYTFKQNSATGWARLACGEVRILETGSSETVYVGLAAPAALAASHTITLPLAAPAGTELVSMTSAGVVAADGKHGDRILCLSGAAAAAVTGVSFTTNPGEATSTASTNIVLPIPLREGDRIKSITVARFGDGAVDLQFDAFKVTPAGASTNIGGPVAVTNAAAAWSDSTIDVTDTTIASGLVVYLNMFANATGARFNNIRVTYDRP
jgi:hypothetical protein